VEASGRRRVGRYEIVREVGRGGMATVYVARQADLERRVALKELRALGMLDASFAQRFLREARLAGSLSHPNIVTVHDYFEYEQVPYIAMEYLARGSLRPFIGRLTLPQVCGVIDGLLAGLAHAERHEVVHRDIKPENLLVTLDGSIKIADFGIAKATHALEAGSTLTAIGTTMGTPNYIAPEQAMAQRLGPWTDLYSVGVTAFELLVGRTPFGDTQEPMGIVLRHIHEPLPRVSDLVPNVDPRISEWVGWLAAKAPSDRPRSAAQAWDALEEVLLQVLGPRWHREAPLTLAGDAEAAGTWSALRPSSLRTTAGARAATGYPAAGMAGPMSTVLAAGAGIRPEDAALAATIPPRQHPPDAGVPAGPRWPRRLAAARKVVIVAAILLGVGAAALTANHGSQMAPAGDEPSQFGAQAAPTQAASKQAAPTQVAPGLTTPAPATPTPQPPVSGAAGRLADQAAPARRLARTYELAASTSTDPAVAGALLETANSYRAAAKAAARGDLAAYAAAMVSATNSRRDVSIRSTPTAPSGSSRTTPSCAGDSISDDPSDDACGDN
jgi:tRNA A-37 threonylcarbamoyl transferase component Bud32